VGQEFFLRPRSPTRLPRSLETLTRSSIRNLGSADWKSASRLKICPQATDYEPELRAACSTLRSFAIAVECNLLRDR
jgi:hypothetical protein